jgi:hypothetical protein
MTKNNNEIQLNCLFIEQMVKNLVLQGITDNEELVAKVNQQYHPNNQWEMEMYSEAILFAKLSILN